MPNIEFEYLDKYSFEVCDRPVPGARSLPKWFRDMAPYDGGKLSVSNRVSSASAKKCTPMLDGMSAGYTIHLWSDVIVHWEEDTPFINWRVDHNVFSLHGPSSREIPPPVGYHNTVFKYLTWFRAKLPAGYSLLVQPPANRNPLPFMAVPAVIDSDRVAIDTNIPVWISKEANGVIKAGTPIAQIIPFRREKWTSSFSQTTRDQHIINEDNGFKKTIVNNYVKNIWHKKEFL
jgi:hypothetical protein